MMMEDPEQDVEHLPSFTQTLSRMLSAGVPSEPQQEPQPEPHEETPPSGALQLEQVESRILELHNRQAVLQRMQNLRKKEADKCDSSREEMTSEDSEEESELENVQKELEELQLLEQQLEGQTKNLALTAYRSPSCSSIYKNEKPYGGIYTLPPPQLPQPQLPQPQLPQPQLPPPPQPPPPPQLPQGIAVEEKSVETPPAAEKSTDPIVAADSLGSMPATTRCPSCGEDVVIEIHSRVSEAMWLLCCVWTVLGCVAGCCLFPFFLDHLKEIQHRCPLCQAAIYTLRPL